MTLLTTWPDTGPELLIRRTSDPVEIAAALAPLGVRFERWPVRRDVPDDADTETVLAAYGPWIDRLSAEDAFTTVDVLGLRPDGDDPGHPAKARAAREKFLREHTHGDDEVRFFASGSGVFYLHIDGEVHAVLCERGDLLGVPRGTTHWFDMGTRPSFTAIRFFRQADGWAGDFTGSAIATLFPDHDAIVAGNAADGPPAV
ncbi:1,2-dihydroxy-3-keto-5-methylthiopentene dioxygenase [Streptomyces sp. KHY 26]|uniref:1,2-dihydroxy-3-keto-5-methylthiopentene dioxygenase n=1 Tax=Streptomyces sp. KHY 26 TaxID=3097359 RepID=UPI00376ED5AD